MTIRAGNPVTRTQTTAGRGYILAAWIKAIGRALDAAGCDSSALLAEAGFDLKSLDSGTTYKEILDETRHSLALTYLSAPHHGVGEILYLLGFSWRAGTAAP
jgi:hypothetical protein